MVSLFMIHTDYVGASYPLRHAIFVPPPLTIGVTNAMNPSSCCSGMYVIYHSIQNTERQILNHTRELIFRKQFLLFDNAANCSTIRSLIDMLYHNRCRLSKQVPLHF